MEERAVPLFSSLVMKLSLYLSCLVTATCLSSLSAAAPKSSGFEDDTPPPPKPTAPVKRTFTSKGEVVSFTAFSLTLKGPKGEPNHEFAFTENTKIVNNDKSAGLGDIKVGKSVGLLAKKIAKTENQLLIVNVGSKLDSDLDKPDTPPEKKASETSKKSSSDSSSSNSKPKKKKKPSSSND